MVEPAHGTYCIQTHKRHTFTRTHTFTQHTYIRLFTHTPTLLFGGLRCVPCPCALYTAPFHFAGCWGELPSVSRRERQRCRIVSATFGGTHPGEIGRDGETHEGKPLAASGERRTGAVSGFGLRDRDFAGAGRKRSRRVKETEENKTNGTGDGKERQRVGGPG